MIVSVIRHSRARVVNFLFADDTKSTYAIYNGPRLSKFVVIKLRAFNQTTINRLVREYDFTLLVWY
ncbi:unnamed protein product [Penicillium salamii]|nr:unnamed protein product [Penicillium salamii]